MDKRLVQNECVFETHNWDMHIAQQIIWKKKLDEYDEILDCTYFEKQYDQTFPLDV
jgi:hypothetical protein